MTRGTSYLFIYRNNLIFAESDLHVGYMDENFNLFDRRENQSVPKDSNIPVIMSTQAA